MSGSAAASAGSTRASGKDLDAALEQLKPTRWRWRTRRSLVVCDLERFAHPHQLDQHGLRRSRVRPRRTCATPATAQKLEMGIRRAGAAAARHDPPATSPRWRREKFAALAQRPARQAGTSRRPWRISSTAWSSACSPRTSGCCRTRCSRACSRRRSARRPSSSRCAATLFAAMQTGGRLGFEHVDWFNGGLFDDDDALPLEQADIERALDAAELDWSRDRPVDHGHAVRARPRPGQAQPARRPLHRREKIMKIVEPVIVRPLEARMGGRPRRQIEAAAGARREQAEVAASARTQGARNDAAERSIAAFLDRLRALPRARPGLRLRQLPLSRAAR